MNEPSLSTAPAYCRCASASTTRSFPLPSGPDRRRGRETYTIPGRCSTPTVGEAPSPLVLAAASGDASAVVRPLGAAALSPVIDLTLSGAGMQARADPDPIGSRDMIVQFVAADLDGADAEDVRAPPPFGPLKGLPPIRIDVGEDETFLDDPLRCAERAAAEGVDVSLNVWAGLPRAVRFGADA